jgi:hypothetical protein
VSVPGINPAADGCPPSKGTVTVTAEPLNNDNGLLDALETRNLLEARQLFARMYVQGFLDDIGYGFVDSDPFTGLGDKAFSFRFRGKIGKQAWIDGSEITVIAHMDIESYSGAEVFRNGALTLPSALGTVAHEIWHLEPRTMKIWKAAVRAGQGGNLPLARDFAGLAEFEANQHASRVVQRYKDLLRQGRIK